MKDGKAARQFYTSPVLPSERITQPVNEHDGYDQMSNAELSVEAGKRGLRYVRENATPDEFRNELIAWLCEFDRVSAVHQSTAQPSVTAAASGGEGETTFRVGDLVKVVSVEPNSLARSLLNHIVPVVEVQGIYPFAVCVESYSGTRGEFHPDRLKLIRRTTPAPEPVDGETELKGCPWCGNVPDPPYNVGETYARLRHKEGCCLGLGGTLRQEQWIPGSAFEAWNTRADLHQPSRLTDETGALFDEVSRRMDAVVDAAVEWRGSDADWQDKAEVLETAIDLLLELRSKDV